MKGFLWFIFADHQNEYNVSLRHYTFFKDEYFVVTAKSAKNFNLSLENYRAYVIFQ